MKHAHACSRNLGAHGCTEELHQIQNEWVLRSCTSTSPGDLITKYGDSTVNLYTVSEKSEHRRQSASGQQKSYTVLQRTMSHHSSLSFRVDSDCDFSLPVSYDVQITGTLEVMRKQMMRDPSKVQKRGRTGVQRTNRNIN